MAKKREMTRIEEAVIFIEKEGRMQYVQSRLKTWLMKQSAGKLNYCAFYHWKASSSYKLCIILFPKCIAIFDHPCSNYIESHVIRKSEQLLEALDGKSKSD